MKNVNYEKAPVWIFVESVQQQTGGSAVKANYHDWPGTKFKIKKKAIKLFSFSLHGKC